MIKISNLSNKRNNRSYSFSDIHFDLQEKQVSNNRQNNDIVSGNDISIDYDEKAIINSLVNILLQRRYLNPLFNINLRQYIGKPASDMSALALGNDIEKGIALFEPRIKTKKIIVQPNLDNNSYKIFLLITLPNFSQQVKTLEGLFDNLGNLSFVNKENI